MILKTMKFIMSTIVEHFHDDQFNAEVCYFLLLFACMQFVYNLFSSCVIFYICQTLDVRYLALARIHADDGRPLHTKSSSVGLINN